MFEKNTYITKGIKESLPDELVSLLWLTLQKETKWKKDYLQIFEFKNIGQLNEPILEVKWRQEKPKHIETFYVKGIILSVEKVWVICDGEETEDEISTMLLPEEY